MERVGVGQGVGRGVHGPKTRQGVRRCTVQSGGTFPSVGTRILGEATMAGKRPSLMVPPGVKLRLFRLAGA
ncbi:Hypothetical protein AA314_09642 [Archangium gephyra]|uniref:Uncharacterized protein n=1 Tax=Archangium gephyra TaxID=48 RepID=A0AAC8QJ25_9BACT|nr:Hypothetical protein AA314_09642 [Archangium gephyra]